MFRIGGDEFAVVLQNGDFENREALVHRFNVTSREICDSAQNKWDEVHVSVGMAVYDPTIDRSVSDTARRADKDMYVNKQIRKEV